MGWFFETAPDHEGYLVGFVKRAEVNDPEIVEELGYPDRRTTFCSHIAAGCDCGWRSPRWKPKASEPAEYAPHSIIASEDDEERGRALWRRHIENDCR